MFGYRIIALDLDGTLLTSERAITQQTLDILNTERDSSFLTTGIKLGKIEAKAVIMV